MEKDHDSFLQNFISSRKQQLNRLAEKHELELLVLLGSYGTVSFKPGKSDIDLAYLSRKKLQVNEHLELIRDFCVFFEYDKLDLIDLRHASGLLKFEVADKGRLLFQSEQGFFERYRLYCIRYYYDTLKFREMKKNYFREQLGVLRDEQSG